MTTIQTVNSNKDSKYSYVKNVAANLSKISGIHNFERPYRTDKALLLDSRNVALDEKISIQIQPLVEKGAQIRDHLVENLKYSGEWNNISEIDKEQINNLSETQLALVSLVMSEEPPVKFEIEHEYNVQMIRSCVGVALGISGITNLYTNTLALGTARTAVQVLKTIGSRYLSYIGIAWMVWDFYDCMTEIEKERPNVIPYNDDEEREIQKLEEDVITNIN